MGYTAIMLDVGVDGNASTFSRVLRARVDTGALVVQCDQSGQFDCGPGERCGVATVTAVEPGVAHTVLLFVRRGMWELYVNDVLVQTYVYGGPWGRRARCQTTAAIPTDGAWAGSVGLACSGGAAAVFEEFTVGRVEL